MTIALRVLAGLAGAFLVLSTAMSAIRTFVVPRGGSTRLTRFVFVSVRMVFNARMRFSATFEDRDRVMALYAPISLLLLPVAWMVLVGTGYALVYIGLLAPGVWPAVRDSGSS